MCNWTKYGCRRGSQITSPQDEASFRIRENKSRPEKHDARVKIKLNPINMNYNESRKQRWKIREPPLTDIKISFPRACKRWRFFCGARLKRCNWLSSRFFLAGANNLVQVTRLVGRGRWGRGSLIIRFEMIIFWLFNTVWFTNLVAGGKW